jgi:hypothetical protein
MCRITSVLSNKVLGLDLHLMPMEPSKTLQELLKQYRTKILWEKEICFAKSGSRSEDEEGASASRKLDTSLPRLEGDIQDAGSIGGPNSNLIELQRDLTALTSKYEACHSREGWQKLERERVAWVLERACMKEEFKVLKRSEVRIQGLHGVEQKKCATLAQQLADVSA